MLQKLSGNQSPDIYGKLSFNHGIVKAVTFHAQCPMKRHVNCVTTLTVTEKPADRRHT